MRFHPLAGAAVQRIAGRLGEIGWTQTGDEEPAFYLQEATGVVFQVHQTMSTRRLGVSFNPTRGVRHIDTSRLVAQFKGYRPRAGVDVASFGGSLADILHQHGQESGPFTRWLVRSADDVEAVADILYEDVVTYGMPFFRSLSTLEEIITRLERVKRHQELSGHLATADALAGRMPEALAALAEYAAEVQNQQPPKSTRSCKFVRSFIEHFGIDESTLSFEVRT